MTQFFSNVLFRDARNSLFPCESIYGTIEVKSSLSVEELTTSIDNIKSVKTLSRAESDMLDFLPQRRLSVGGGLTYSQTRRNPYLGVVFAYDGIRGDTVAEFLNQRLQDNPILADLLPDFVFCYSKGYMILRLNGNKLRGVAAPFGGSYNMFGSLDIGPDTLPLFYLTLNVCLNNIQLRGTDLNPYWIQVVNEAEAQRKVPDHAS
jgi:hypothetical protein